MILRFIILEFKVLRKVMHAIHGRWKIEVNNNVLMQWFADSWNEEAIIEYIKEFRERAKPLIGKQWAIISIFDDWELGVPAIEGHVKTHCEWFIKQGCIKDCHVYSNDAAKRMQLEKMIPLKEPNYERRVFTHIDDAVTWLASEHFVLSDNSFLIENTKRVS